MDSYLCLAVVLPIGVGHTGPEVVAGLHITQTFADELLAKESGAV